MNNSKDEIIIFLEVDVFTVDIKTQKGILVLQKGSEKKQENKTRLRLRTAG